MEADIVLSLRRLINCNSSVTQNGKYESSLQETLKHNAYSPCTK